MFIHRKSGAFLMYVILRRKKYKRETQQRLYHKVL